MHDSPFVGHRCPDIHSSIYNVPPAGKCRDYAAGCIVLESCGLDNSSLDTMTESPSPLHRGRLVSTISIVINRTQLRELFQKKNKKMY